MRTHSSTLTLVGVLGLTLGYSAHLAAAPLPSTPPPDASTAAPPAKPAVNVGVAKAEESEDPALKAMAELGLSIQRLTLENGLRVVLNVDTTFPTVAVSMTYGVGSRNEEKGRSGFAHLFEHMMFQGSRHVKKGEHFTEIAARGGTMNGTTSTDRTNYYEVLPSSELALGLWLEADRLKWLDVTPENFENQRKVVQEEYRMRVASAPYRMGHIRLEELAYQGYFPYEHSTIGSMEDLDNAKFEWVLAFHQRYYAPNNAVLTIAGNFDADQAVELVRHYFGDAKPVANLPKFQFPPMPEQKAERREQVEDQNIKTPGFYYSWPIAPTHSPEHYAIELLALVLTDGESSRLYRDLVLEKSLAQSVSAWTTDRPGQDMLQLQAILTETAKLPDVQRAIDDHIAQLQKSGPTANELARAVNRLRTQFIFGLQPNGQRAIRLGEYESIWGDAKILTRELEGYLKVTPADVQRAAAQMLIREKRTVVDVVPARKASK
ncbi:MAG: pitrilysin family protein [Polyangiaceae bacterium]|nr:pitrilysin family protein [Polyangiaceae bacterium]